MPFRDLHTEVQEKAAPISTRWLRERAILHSEIILVKEQWSGVLDPQFLRGFYIEGPLGPPVPLLDHQALIVLARLMCTGPLGEYERRFIYTKELMHVFDTAEEKADDPDKFDVQIDKFGDPSMEMSPQFRAELKAFWRALMVLCPENARQKLVTDLAADTFSPEVMAAAFRLPVYVIQQLVRPDFKVRTDPLLI